MGMHFNLIMHMLFGGPRAAPAPSVTEYSLFGINEIGTGPIKIAVMFMVITIPVACLGICSYYCCCRCNKLMCCRKGKEAEPSEQKPRWRRCFLQKQKDPVLPILMQQTDTYEPMYSGSMSIRSERTYSGNRRRMLPLVP